METKRIQVWLDEHDAVLNRFNQLELLQGAGCSNCKHTHLTIIMNRQNIPRVLITKM